MTGIDLISEERRRQQEQEGWSAKNDDLYNQDGQLARAAACYAASSVGIEEIYSSVRIADPGLWPWEERYDKRQKHDRIKKLVIAGALIAAEVDRLLRKSES